MFQTLFGKNIAFSFRTFRFSSGQSLDNQAQTISCEFYLEPTDNVAEEQAADCTCYNEQECTTPVFDEWAEWSACSVTCGDGERTRSRTCTALCSNIDDTNSDHDLTQTEVCNQTVCSKFRSINNFLHKILIAYELLLLNYCYLNDILGPVFEEWSEWSSCSVTCGDGQRNRSRTCIDHCTIYDSESNVTTVITDAQAEDCNQPACCQVLDDERNYPDSYNHQPVDAGNAHEKDYFHISAPNYPKDLCIGFSNGYTGHDDEKWEIVMGGNHGREFVIRPGNSGVTACGDYSSNCGRNYTGDTIMWHRVRDNFAIQLTDGNISIYEADSNGVKGDLILEWNDASIVKADRDTLTVSGGHGGSGDVTVRGICAN